MPELNDHELLAEFARTGAETAFAALVARHVNLAYSTALRFTGNPHHAEEITQAVFIILARKAKSIWMIQPIPTPVWRPVRIAGNIAKGGTCN